MFFFFHCTSLHRPASSPADQCTHECTRQKSRRQAGVRTQTTAAATHGSNAVKCLICSRTHREQAWCRVFVIVVILCAPFSWAAERQWRRLQRAELNKASRCSLSLFTTQRSWIHNVTVQLVQHLSDRDENEELIKTNTKQKCQHLLVPPSQT